MYKLAKLILVVSGLALAGPVAMADECGPVNDFVKLGDRANKCVVAIRLNRPLAGETIKSDVHCKGVRTARADIEGKVGNMPQAAVNRCANKNQKRYTAAATALQKMYQLELSLKTR